jgi:hypothetical protein
VGPLSELFLGPGTLLDYSSSVYSQDFGLALGGCLHVAQRSKAIVHHGAQISDCESEGHGGCISLKTESTLELYGAVVEKWADCHLR